MVQKELLLCDVTFFRRHPAVEYYILAEMIEARGTEVQHAETLIDLAHNMLVTGMQYKQR